MPKLKLRPLTGEERVCQSKTTRFVSEPGFAVGASGRDPLITVVTLDKFELIARPLFVRAGDVSFECLPYQLSTVRDMRTMVVTGDGESGFGSGEGA